MRLTCSVNGTRRDVEIGSTETLLDLLRDRLGLRGTKNGCSEGECGACTVLVDGLAIDSCLYLAAAVERREVTTVEGLAPDGELADGRTPIFTDGRLAYTLRAFGQADQLTYVEVQSGFILTEGESGGVDFAATRGWLVLIDPDTA